MRKEQIIISGLIGTTAMTAFSYLISKDKHRNLKEPEILGDLLHRLIPELPGTFSQIAGFKMHYAMGFLFVLGYDQIWKKTMVQANSRSGALLGALSGLIGIAVWKLVFMLHPNPPAKNLKRYFSHLLLAHLIFGIAAAKGYRLNEDKALVLEQ